MNRSRILLLTLLLICCSPLLLRAKTPADKSRELLGYLPGNINTLSILRLKEIIQSPRAEQEGWAAQLEEALAAGINDLPPWIETLVVGSVTRPGIPEEVWATGVLHRPESVPFKAIAEHFSAPIETVAGRPVIQTNRGSFLVDLPNNILGFHRPAHRQELAGWIRQILNNNQPKFEAYLQKAAAQPDHLVLSINLQDMLAPEFIRQHLGQDPRFAQHQGLIDQLVPLIAGLKGVTLTANVAKTTECQISIDFSSPVGPSASIVKTLFLAMLEDAGAMIEEFPAARISTVENSVRLSCPLSNDSLQRLVSLIVPPRAPYQLPEETPATPPAAEPQTTPQPAVDQATLELRANRRYLSSVNRMIDDLFRSSQNATDSRRVLTWHETFARRIETLPTANVSPELVEFGRRTAQHFRTLATSLRGEGIKVDAQNRAITHEVTHVDPGWAYANYWGGFGYRPASVQVSSNLQQIREQQAAAVIAGGLERAKIWDMIRADQAEANNRIRRN